MNIHRALLAASTVFLLQLTALSQEPTSPLTLSQAAKLAEDAVTEAGLPADCFVRAVSLIEGATPYYRVHYQRPGSWIIGRGGTGVEDVIHVSMDGKVTFAKLNRTIYLKK